MRVACVQLRARDVEDSERALEEALAAAVEAARRADLVVLPEATYPGYVLHEAARHLDPAPYERALEEFASIAREQGAWMTVGLVRPVGSELANSAVVLGPDGRVASITDKSFLWHFDRRWFRPGRPGEVVALPWGTAGVFVCADARMTEIPRRLAAAGARLLLDPTALVLSPLGVNAQIEYMLAARAWENGAFLAVANKCGAEAGIARYGGRSAILDSWGERLVEAPADEPAIVVAEIDLEEAPGPPVAVSPSGYPELSAPIESLPIAEALAAGPPRAALRLALLREGGEPDRLLEELDVNLGVGRSVARRQNVLSSGNGEFRLGDRTHASGEVVLHGETRLGLLSGDRLAVPEEARSLMLRGAGLIVWDGAGTSLPDEVLATRADENRVFLLSLEDGDAWRVHGPTGGLLGEGPHDGLDAVFVELPLALAWQKEMAPGTHVVLDRPLG